jgi:hypothetical protein
MPDHGVGMTIQKWDESRRFDQPVENRGFNVSFVMAARTREYILTCVVHLPV